MAVAALFRRRDRGVGRFRTDAPGALPRYRATAVSATFHPRSRTAGATVIVAG